MKFFEPQSLPEFDESKPRVVLVTDRLQHEWTKSPTLEELGYVPYNKDILMRATYYARRPWVWLLKTALWAKWKWFKAVYWGYGRFWYLSSLDGSRFRLSKLRPGTGAMAQARADISGKRLQIENMYGEISDLKLEKDAAYRDGQLKGWDQHMQVVEQFIDEKVKGARTDLR